MDMNYEEFKVEFTSIQQICRCCLSTDKRMTGIQSFRDHLNDLADIIISETDGLPQWLCYMCGAMLAKSVRFKQRVIQSQEILYEYHRRCLPFPIDGQDLELTIYKNPQLTQTGTLVIDASNSKIGYHRNLEHEKRYAPRKDTCTTSPDICDEISIKDEFVFSEADDNMPLLELKSKDKTADLSLDIKEEKREKKKKVKKKVKSKEKKIDLDLNLESTRPKMNSLRKPIEIDETKIRIIKLDPAEQLKQREEESKATMKFPFQCHLCFKGFNFEVKLKNHMLKHSPARGPHRCDLCSMYFPTTYSYTVHTHTHARRYECVVCGRRMSDRLSMLNHYRTQHEGITTVYTCNICGKLSNNDKTHRGHMRNVHSGLRVTCDECGKTFVNRDSLVEHQLIHQGIKNYECEQCGKKFRTRNQIRLHVVKHSNAKDYYCVECDVKFKSAHSLRQHLKRTSRHKDYKSFKYECATCSKRFETAARLAAHTRVQHEGERPHRCATCGAALASRSSLAKHARAVHAGQRAPPAHCCHTCGKMFRAKSTLVNHVRTHTGEKPFACGACGRHFAQRTAMRTHVRLVHLKAKRGETTKTKLPSPETNKGEAYKDESPLAFDWNRQGACEYFTVTAGP